MTLTHSLAPAAETRLAQTASRTGADLLILTRWEARGKKRAGFWWVTTPTDISRGTPGLLVQRCPHCFARQWSPVEKIRLRFWEVVVRCGTCSGRIVKATSEPRASPQIARLWFFKDQSRAESNARTEKLIGSRPLGERLPLRAASLPSRYRGRSHQFFSTLLRVPRP